MKQIKQIKNNIKFIFIFAFLFSFYGCFGGIKHLKVVDYTDQRVVDLVLTKKVIGKREFLFFSTTKMGLFLEGAIQGIITDYAGNPIEGVTVKAVADVQRGKTEEAGFAPIEETASSFVNLTFTPGISDSQGIYKVRFSLPVVDNEVDVRGKLIYNPGWDQQKINLGKAYEPQMKESNFRLYYNLDTGFLAFAEGIRAVIVQPVGQGEGRMKALPGSTPPETTVKKPEEQKKEQTPQEEDIFKAFNF